jgi:hypothetical protein
MSNGVAWLLPPAPRFDKNRLGYNYTRRIIPNRYARNVRTKI